MLGARFATNEIGTEHILPELIQTRARAVAEMLSGKACALITILLAGMIPVQAQESYVFIEQEKVVSESVFPPDAAGRGTADTSSGYQFDSESKVLRYSIRVFPQRPHYAPFVEPFNPKEVQFLFGQQIQRYGPVDIHTASLYPSSEPSAAWEIGKGSREAVFLGLEEPSKDSLHIEVGPDAVATVTFNEDTFRLAPGESRVLKREFTIPVGAAFQQTKAGNPLLNAYGNAMKVAYTLEDTFTNYGRIPARDLVCQTRPDVSGDNVIFFEDAQTQWNLVLINLSTGERMVLVANEFQKMSAKIDGTTVVWQELRDQDEGWDIYATDINTRMICPITQGNGDQMNPDVSEGIIVWGDWRKLAGPGPANFEDFRADTDIYMHNLQTGQTVPVATDETWQSLPSIHRNVITWGEEHDQERGLVVYDTMTQQRRNFMVGRDAAKQPSFMSASEEMVAVFESVRREHQHYLSIYSPAKILLDQVPVGDVAVNEDRHPMMDGSRVVWEESSREIHHRVVWMYDSLSGSKTQLTDGMSNCTFPSISGDIVVWVDDRNGNGDIYALDLTTNQQRRVTTE